MKKSSSGSGMSFFGSSAEKSPKPDTPLFSPVAANPETILTAIVPQFIKSIPAKADGGMRPKLEVLADLEKKRDRLRDKLRAGFEKNKVVADSHVEEVCEKLDEELNSIIEAYARSVSEASLKYANNTIKEVIPRDPGEVGISLPALSEAKLEEALVQKRRDINAQLLKQVEGKYHSSWYVDNDGLNLEQELDIFAQHVRGK